MVEVGALRGERRRGARLEVGRAVVRHARERESPLLIFSRRLKAEKHLVVLHHVELPAGALLNGVPAVLKRIKLCAQSLVAVLLNAVGLILKRERLLKLGGTKPCAARPEELEPHDADACRQHEHEDAHHRFKASVLLAKAVEGVAAGILSHFGEVFLDAKKLVVLGHAVGATHGTGLDLTGVETNGDVGDRAVFRLARAVGDDGGVARALGHLNGFKRFGKRTDLVDLDEDGVRNPLFNAFLKDGGIRHEEVVTHELDALAESGRELGPAFPVAFSHAVFDRDDRVLVDPVLENSDPFLGREGLARGLLHDVLAVFEEFARGAVETDHDVLACFKAGSLDGFEDELDGFFMAFALGGEAALVTDGRGHAAGVDDLLEGMERLGTVADMAMFGMSSTSDDQTSSSTYPFYVNLDSSDGLMLGQHVYIELDEGQDDNKVGIWLNDYFIVDADTDSPYVWIADAGNKLVKRDVVLGQYDENLAEYEIADGLTEKDKIAFPTDELKEGMSAVEGTADQTTSAMWDTSDEEDSLDESGEDYSDLESDGAEPEMIEDSDMTDATEDISSGDDLVPMEGAPTE